MSPIFIRPAREQHEHDRLIRHLQSKYARKFEVVANVGDEQLGPVKLGALTLYPDLVLMDGKKLVGLVEVESGESVNNLEAMAQWVHFANARVPFHLYVPAMAYEATRRLADTYKARITEIWTYRPAVEGFDLVRMHYDAAAAGARSIRPVPSPPAPPPAPKPLAAVKPAAKPAPKPAKPAVKALKSAKTAKAKPVAKASKPTKPAAKPARAATSSKAVGKAKAKPAARRPAGKVAPKTAPKRKR